MQRSNLPAAKRSESGAALLETAIALPLLLLVLFGIFEFGLAFARAQVLSNAAREGAREASLFRPTCTASTVQGSAETVIRQTGARFGMAPASLQIQMTQVCVRDQRVQVSVVFTHELPVLSALAQVIGGDGVSGTIPLTGQARMLNEMR